MRKAGLIAGIVVALAIGAAPAMAKPGALYIAASQPPGEADVIRMNPKTGAIAGVAELPEVGGVDGEGDNAAFGSDGFLYVSDEDAPAVFRVNVKTGAATIFSQDPVLDSPWGLDVGPTGQILVGDYGAFESPDEGAIFGLSRSGAATTISAEGALDRLNGVAAAPSGNIFVPLIHEASDPVELLTVDPRSGSQQAVAEFAGTENPTGITVGPNGTVFIARQGSVESYRPKTDSTGIVSPDLNAPVDLELGFDGKLYVVETMDDTVLRINVKSGSQSTVGETETINAAGIAVQPPKCAGKFATVVGTNKKDKIKGSKGADIIAGLKGNDKIKGLKGKDRLCGGAGKDKLIGGPSKDKIKGGAGKDVEKQ